MVLILLFYFLISSCDLSITQEGKDLNETKYYSKSSLTASVEYATINENSTYQCTNYDLFKTFISQYSGYNNNDGNKIYNRNLFFSTSGITYKADGSFYWSGVSSVLGVDSAYTINTVSASATNRTYYNTIVSTPNDNVTATGIVYGDSTIENISSVENSFSFKNFIMPSSSVSDPYSESSTNYTFSYVNNYLNSITYSKTFSFSTWYEDRAYKKYYYKLYEIIVTKPYQLKFKDDSVNLYIDASYVSNVKISGNYLTLSFADLDPCLTGNIFDFTVIDYDNNLEEYVYTFSFN